MKNAAAKHQARICFDASSGQGEAAEFARSLTRELGIPWQLAEAGQAAFVLRVDSAGLALHSTREAQTGPVRVDFAAPAVQRRARDRLRGQFLLRAVGTGSEVLDATAGLGRDAFLLASAGKRVHLLEREPAVFALLADGLRRAALDAELAPVAARMELQHGDFLDWGESRRCDVAYLDPMFPLPQRRARAKKEMAFLQQLVEQRSEAGLLAKALGCARDRVVVKRPPREGWLEETEPAFSHGGRVSRYDVYLPRSKRSSTRR